MLKPLLVIVAVCLVCGVAWGDGKGIVITDPAFSVSMVQGVSDPGTGLCASYKVVSWKDAGLWVDGGALFRENLDDANPFIGLIRHPLGSGLSGEWSVRVCSCRCELLSWERSCYRGTHRGRPSDVAGC